MQRLEEGLLRSSLSLNLLLAMPVIIGTFEAINNLLDVHTMQKGSAFLCGVALARNAQTAT